tara:strand:- start:773 stop:1045 length:273 start_codon:yes stop_codon:yes gene_type:complete
MSEYDYEKHDRRKGDNMSREMSRELGEMHVKVKDIHNLIKGNGKPGLVTEHLILKSRVDSFEGAIKFGKWFIGFILSVSVLDVFFHLGGY